MTDAERLLTLLASNSVDVDHIAETKKMVMRAEMERLLSNPEVRDIELFADAASAYGVEASLAMMSMVQLNSIPVAQRTKEFYDAITIIVTACWYQAFDTVVMGELIKMSFAHAESVNALSEKMDREELKAAAKKGIAEMRKAEKEKRGTRG